MNRTIERRRVVVTGMGVVSPIGMGLNTYWKSLIEGRTGIDKAHGFETDDLASQIAAQALAYNPDEHFEKKDQRRHARFVQLAVVAAKEAFADSGLRIDEESSWRAGSFLGCGIGGIDVTEEQILTMAEKGARRVSPLLIPKIIPNMAAGQVAIELGLRGPNLGVVSACASAHAMGESLRTIRRGEADVMISGGAEAAVSRIALAGFGNMKALSTRNSEPQRASRPFDRERDGFVMGEGAALLVLEELEHAKARGAKIYAEFVGYGATDDAFHITAPDESGAGGARAMMLAIRDAGLNPEDIQHINAHGTSTPINDRVETQAIKAVFNSHARKVAITSNKSMVGHLLGAAAAVEAISTVMTLHEGIVPPTINYEYPDPDCDLDYTPNTARELKVDAAISNSLGFGGHNGTLAFRRWNG